MKINFFQNLFKCIYKKIKNLFKNKYLKIIFIYLVLWFISAILLKFCENKFKFSFIDSLFVAGSALSNTGLTVTRTDQLSLSSQIIIFFSIFVGALGISSIKILLWYFFKYNQELDVDNSEFFIKKKQNLKKIILIGSFTIIFMMLLGWFIIWLFLNYNSQVISTNNKNIPWISLFLSVSSTANAGFDLIGKNSIETFSGHYWILIFLIIQIVIGGLGFPIIYEVFQWAYNILNRKRLKLNKFKFSFYFKIAIIFSFVTWILGFLIIFLIELNYIENGIFKNRKISGESIMNLIFVNFSARAVGFSTFSLKRLNKASQLILSILMYIGTLPYSQCGGIKVTTIILFIIGLRYLIKNQTKFIFWKKKIYKKTIFMAISLTILSVLFILIFSTFFLILEPEHGFLNSIFTISSAFGTTGLSILSYNEIHLLNFITKLLIIITMFIGQINFITFYSLLISFDKPSSNKIDYPDEKLNIF